MGRDTSGVQGMNVSDKVDGTPNRVLAMDIARPETDVFVVTENGYGKRTPVEDYPVKGRGTKGNLTAKLTEKKGGLAGALIVREHQDLLFISVNGMVQRTSVKGISQHRPRDPGRQGDEHRRRRPRQRRRPRRRGAGGRRAPRGRGRGRSRSGADSAAKPTEVPAMRAPPRLDEADAEERRRPRVTRPTARPAAFASIRGPEKGGGPKLSDMFVGTLEVTGR